MSWRLAYSLSKLREQINAAYPNRSKVSDGTIGDAAHAASASDHNPNGFGVVCAFDLTNDPGNGLDAHALADHIRVNRHPDLKYIISNSRITGAWNGWNWETYYGSNPHDKHVHFSVGVGSDGYSQQPYDDTTDWNINYNGMEEEEMTYDDWIMYNWFRLLEEDYSSLAEFEKAIQDNAQWHYNSKHTLRDVLNDEAKQPNFAKNIARDERARRKALETQLASVNTQLQKAINDKNITLTQLQQLQAQTQTGTIPQTTINTINETNSIVKKIWDAIVRLWRV